jgi:hypothetical protein
MELTNNQDMVIPIMAACLLARAAASIFCPTPVYKDFAERMIQDYERQQAERLAAEEQRAPPTVIGDVGPTSAYGEPVAPTDIPDEKPEP